MIRRANAYVSAALLLGALAVPSIALAASGGVGLSPTAPSGPSFSASGVQPGNLVVSASGSGITISTRESAFLRNQLRFTGQVPVSAAGDTVEIERLGRQTGWVWAPTAHGTAASDGSFTAVWHTNHIGPFAIRAVVQRGTQASIQSAGVNSSPSLNVIVYRPAIATYYGPGFYSQSTACGQTLHKNTLGVANRTLPCGTRVALYYQGKTITVPVIDRGPYANNADWDLTEATAEALGMSGIATIGAVSLPGSPH